MKILTTTGRPVMTGDQIASHNPFVWNRLDTYLPWMIRRATGSFWNHWLGIWIREDGVIFIVEMQAGNAKKARRITRFEIWQQRHPDRIYELLPGFGEVSREQLDRFIGGYDYVSLLIRQPLFMLTGFWIGGKKDGTYTCSEYWARVWELPEAWRLSPKDMAAIFGASRR